jgi:hypothetical protein
MAAAAHVAWRCPASAALTLSDRLTIGFRAAMIANVVPIGDRPPIGESGRNLALDFAKLRPRRWLAGVARGQRLAIVRAWRCAMKSILDPTFRYTSSANTDLRKTFARIRRENRKQSQPENSENTPKVTPIFRGQRPAA